jgi:hypothetical protein
LAGMWDSRGSRDSTRSPQQAKSEEHGASHRMKV